ALSIGVASWRLGAGRARKEDPVQDVAGIELHAKPGEHVTAGQPLMTLHTATPERFARAVESLETAVEIGGDAASVPESIVFEMNTRDHDHHPNHLGGTMTRRTYLTATMGP